MTVSSGAPAGAGGPRPTQDMFAGMPTPLYAASPSRLLAWLDCPRRYRMQYLDRPSPPSRPQRAHTSIGIATHNALRDWWLQTRRTPEAGARLVDSAWIDVGFRDAAQSREWKGRIIGEVTAYLAGVDPGREPIGLERTAAFKTQTLAVSGRIDRVDDREGGLVVVDYKTGRRPLSDIDARTSLPLALYAAAVWKTLRRRCVRVELHHVPSGSVAAFEHTDDSLVAKVREAESIARDLRRADAAYRTGLTGEADRQEIDTTWFPPRLSPLCRWCDYRAHCPEGQTVGPEHSSWAALEASPTEPVPDPDVEGAP